jgi:hypothetical protein
MSDIKITYRHKVEGQLMMAVQLHNQQELEELVEMVAVVMVQNQV